MDYLSVWRTNGKNDKWVLSIILLCLQSLLKYYMHWLESHIILAFPWKICILSTCNWGVLFTHVSWNFATLNQTKPTKHQETPLLCVYISEGVRFDKTPVALFSSRLTPIVFAASWFFPHLPNMWAVQRISVYPCNRQFHQS